MSSSEVLLSCIPFKNALALIYLFVFTKMKVPILCVQQDAAKVIKALIAKNPDSMNFNVMALSKNSGWSIWDRTNFAVYYLIQHSSSRILCFVVAANWRHPLLRFCIRRILISTMTGVWASGMVNKSYFSLSGIGTWWFQQHLVRCGSVMHMQNSLLPKLSLQIC